MTQLLLVLEDCSDQARFTPQTCSAFDLQSKSESDLII